MRAEKQYVVEELKAKIEGASAIIFTSYTGASAEQMGSLRALLDERNGGYMIVKNRLFALAAKAGGLDGELPGFAGQVGVAFTDEDSSVIVLKALVDFQKQHEVIELLGGFVGGRPCTAEELKALSKLPPKPVMQAQVLGTLQAVPRGLVSVLAGRLRSLLYLINAHIEAQGGVPDEAAAQAAGAETAADEPADEPVAEEPVPQEQASQEESAAAEAAPEKPSQESADTAGTS